MQDILLEPFSHPCLWRHPIFFPEPPVEIMFAHSRILDHLLHVSVHFHVVILDEILEIDFRTHERTKELRHLCFCVICDECDEQLDVPCLTYLGILDLS